MLAGLLFGTSSLVLNGQPPRPKPKPGRQPVVGFIRNTKDFDGAGCSLWLLHDRTYVDGRYVLLADFEEQAVVNIDGRDTALKLVKSVGANSAPKKGRRSEHY